LQAGQQIQNETGEEPKVKLTNVLLAGLLMIPGYLCAQDAQTPGTPSNGTGLAPGDQIEVHLYDFPELAALPPQPIVVRGDGTVHLPYAGTVKVEGLNPDGAEKVIEDALRTKGIVKEPNAYVSVLASTNLSVRVMGEVKIPKSIPLYAPTPLSFVLEQVGGLTGVASRHLTIIHHSDQMPTSVDYDVDNPSMEALNTLVVPGDVVEVSSQGVFFIVGEVNHPGIYPMGGILAAGQLTPVMGMGMVKNMTMLQALTQGGGITSIAARSKTLLLRTVNGKREAVTVDLVKLEKGEIADPLLHPDDIIYVPSSYIRSQTNNLFGTIVSALYGYSFVKP
jgi:polysaccharide export outer membrane protein